MTPTKLNPGIAKLISGLLDFIDAQLVSQIELDFAALAAKDVIGKLKRTADVLADGDLQDKEQLRVIWGHFLADPEIAESIRLALVEAASRIKNDLLKEVVLLLSNPIVQTIVILSDENQDNGDQLEQVWVDFANSEVFRSFVEAHLEQVIRLVVKNKTIADLLVSLIKMFI